MKKTIMIAVFIAMVLCFAIGISEEFVDAIIIPIEFVNRIQSFNNDNGEWERAGYLICSSYFKDLQSTSYENTSYSLDASNISFGNVNGDLSVTIYSAKHMGLPPEIGDFFTITARVFDPKAMKREDSSVYKNTLAYYESAFGNSITEEDYSSIIDKDHGIQINIGCDESYSMIEVIVHISMIPTEFLNKR